MLITQSPAPSLMLIQNQLVANDGISKLSAGADRTSSQVLVIQGNALSVLEQPFVDFSGFKNLADSEKRVNDGLRAAKKHATFYLDTLQHQLITGITNIQDYFNAQNALSKVLQPGLDNETVITLLESVQEQASNHQSAAKGIVKDLQTLRNDLSIDAGNFNQAVSDLNNAVNGDEGALKSINQELTSINSKISGTIAGVAISGFALAGGAVLIAIGSLAEISTAGVSTALVVGGVGLVIGGVAGTIGASITLANLLEAKSNLLKQKSQLKAEVNLALGLKDSFSALATHSRDASLASQEMANAWGLLSNHLGSLIHDVDNGKQNADSLRLLFLTAAQGDIKTVQTDITRITEQLAGAKRVGTQNDNVVSLIRSEIKAAKAA